MVVVKKGQLATGHDFNLGVLSARTFSDSRTYQLYSDNPVRLSVGFTTKARIESVAIDVVSPEELINVYLSYADAALVELYRQQMGIADSLSQIDARGYLLVRSPGQIGRTPTPTQHRIFTF
jgi:hypothetical protein